MPTRAAVATPALAASRSARPAAPSGRAKREIRVVRQHIDAYNRRDFDAMRAVSHPFLELDWSAASWLGAGVYQGIDAVLAFYAEFFDAFERIIVEPRRFTPEGDGVVVPNVARLRGRDGIEVSAQSTLVFTVRRGKVTRICLRD